ncbi:MAG: carbohydrate kinase family protein [Armatimonadota bacterium]
MAEQFDLVTVGSLFMEITPTTPGESLDRAHYYTLISGGAAANMVFALARLGARVRFITAVGDDEFGTLATGDLASFGVDTGSVRRVAGQLTPVSFCSVDRHGGKQFRFYRVPGFSSPLNELAAGDFRAVTEGRLFDFTEGSIRDKALRLLVFQAARDAHAGGVPVLYSVNLRRNSWRVPEVEVIAIEREAISLADIVVLNAEEVEFITGLTATDGLQVLQELGPKVIVMTRGGDGDMLVRVGEAETAVPVYQVPVIYDVGAGDTFHAGLVAAVLQQELSTMTIDEWAQAVHFGAATAAIRVSTSADPRDLPTFDQVTKWMGRVL